jgi:hypothetical protein
MITSDASRLAELSRQTYFELESNTRPYSFTTDEAGPHCLPLRMVRSLPSLQEQ